MSPAPRSPLLPYYPTVPLKVHERLKLALLGSRRSKLLSATAAAAAALLLLAYLNVWRLHAQIPPDYHEWHARERALPQNDARLPFPQGRSGKYVRVGNHVSKLGWGNVMQEMIFNAYMALESGRTFVFYNYTWDPNPSHEYTRYGDNYTPARIPISAFVNGPIAGDPFPSHSNAQPAVSWDFFDEVCSHPTQIDVDPTAPDVNTLSAASLMSRYISRLQSTDDNCVEFVSSAGKEIFDYILFGDGPRLLTLWPALLASPILTQWTWSPLVRSIAHENYALIHPHLAPSHTGPPDAILPSLLALHIRQGDYAAHCEYLYRHRTPYHGYNSHPSFPDRFGGPTRAFYDAHCVPPLETLVWRVMQVRRDHRAATGRTLQRVYILTNAKRAWLEKFERALRKAVEDDGDEGEEPWLVVASSRDLALTDEQRFVAQAADMMVATRAEVFLGNGWSSLTANSNLLRAVAGRDPATTRFW